MKCDNIRQTYNLKTPNCLLV